MIAQGDVWWADVPDPAGSEPAVRRPVIVIQGDAFNRSAIRTVVCVAVTSNPRWEGSPGNVLLPTRASGLPRRSIANVSQIVTLDKADLTALAGKLPGSQLHLVLSGVDTVLGRRCIAGRTCRGPSPRRLLLDHEQGPAVEHQVHLR